MRPLARFGLAVAFVVLFVAGVFSTTPVYAWCPPGWPTQCRSVAAPAPTIPTLDIAVFTARLLLLRA